jgi:hypothetical protein
MHIIGQANTLIIIPGIMQGINLTALVKNNIPEKNGNFHQYHSLCCPQTPKQEGIELRNLNTSITLNLIMMPYFKT